MNCFENIRANKIDKFFTILAVSSSNSIFSVILLKDVPAALISTVLKMALELNYDTHALTDLYLELTSGTRANRHDVWDSLESETRPINCVYELVQGWAVPFIFE